MHPLLCCCSCQCAAEHTESGCTCSDGPVHWRCSWPGSALVSQRRCLPPWSCDPRPAPLHARERGLQAACMVVHHAISTCSLHSLPRFSHVQQLVHPPCVGAAAAAAAGRLLACWHAHPARGPPDWSAGTMTWKNCSGTMERYLVTQTPRQGGTMPAAAPATSARPGRWARQGWAWRGGLAHSAGSCHGSLRERCETPPCEG